MDVLYKPMYWCSCGNFRTHQKHTITKACNKEKILEGYMEVFKPIFCCSSMEHAYGGVIKFGEYEYCSKSIDVNIIQCEPYPEGVSYVSFPIKFCPFCGEGITTVETINEK